MIQSVNGLMSPSMRNEVGANDRSLKYAMTVSVDLVDIKMFSQSMGTSTQFTNEQSFGR